MISQDMKWILVGDFNTPLCHSKKLGGIEDFSNSIFDFANFISNPGLLDVELLGSKFTWSNYHSGNDLIQVKLDCILICGD